MKNPAVLRPYFSAVCFLFSLAIAVDVRAQFYEKLYSFTEGRAADFVNKGSRPEAGLVLGADGNLYGTTVAEGAINGGTIFKLTQTGELTTLVEFTINGPTNKGNAPGPLIRGGDGNFYGTTIGGGASDFGTVFKVTSAGVLTTLIQFTGNGATNKGDGPAGGLVQGADGNFYGTTLRGGASNLGTIFKMTPGGVLTTLVEFTGTAGANRGSNPWGALVQVSDGTFYGTTQAGGTNGSGTLFKVNTSGALGTIVDFTGNGATNKGSQPIGSLRQGSDGALYGTTLAGGAEDRGTVFKYALGATQIATLVQFSSTGPLRGQWPYGSLVQKGDGYFYGTTAGGGANNLGTVFKMSSAGALTTLLDFTGDGASNKGSNCEAALMEGPDGYLYGTTVAGGAFNYGTVFKMTSAGTLTTLVQFTGNGSTHKGRNPQASVVQASDGNFYGTTLQGGSSDSGTVFAISPIGVLTTKIDFTGMSGQNPGGFPYCDLLKGTDGNFYGTASSGGTNNKGTIFKIDPAATLTTLTNFSGSSLPNKGQVPRAGLIQGNDGNFYGTTDVTGGGSLGGTIFKVTPAGQLTTLYEFVFNGPTGFTPRAPLVLGNDGNFYGSTRDGGANSAGTIYQITPAGSLTTLVHFTGTSGARLGSAPQGALIQGTDGDFYGTTSAGGANNLGTVFKMTPAGALTTLVEFTGTGGTRPGSAPQGALVLGSDGALYGTTSNGGIADVGTIFKVTTTPTFTSVFDFAGDPNDAHPRGALYRDSQGDLYGTTSGSPGDGTIFRLVFAGKPSVYSLDPQPQIGGSALLPCKANARGAITTVTLEYGFGGVPFPHQMTVTSSLSGYQTTSLTAALSGLDQGAVYNYRFRASSPLGTTYTPVSTFTTIAPPAATVTSATNVTQISAVLNGIVNARNYDSSVIFQYGEQNTFDHEVIAVPAAVGGNSDIAVSAAIAGLLKGKTYKYRIVADNVGGTTVSGENSFTTLTEPTATTGAATVLSTTSAQVEGTANAQGSNTQVFFDYGPDQDFDPGTFNSVPAIPSNIQGTANTPVMASLQNLNQGVTYWYRVRGTSVGGEGASVPASFSLQILSGLDQVLPASLFSAGGTLDVSFIPSNVPGADEFGWRFVGEPKWRLRSSTDFFATGLTTGDRVIEFRPVPGFSEPPPRHVAVLAGHPDHEIAEYYQVSGSGSGALQVTITPQDLATDPNIANRAQWRLLGEGNADDPNDLTTSPTWKNSDTSRTGLFAGTYLVEFKPVTANPPRTAPGPLAVVVSNNSTKTVHAFYSLANPLQGATPSPNISIPYPYVGQLRSDSGVATGFVVKNRVVATVAHFLFDETTLSYATNLQWLFQRQAGSYEPVPLPPRGAYLFESYHSHRVVDSGNMQSFGSDPSNDSHNLDAAALYFAADQDSNRGGYGGYLASEQSPNEFVTSAALKAIVGYPVDGIDPVNQGKIHVSGPATNVLTRVTGSFTALPPAPSPCPGPNPQDPYCTGALYQLYTTTALSSSGGNSGGPLCVQLNGAYYPAGIYLGGSGQTLVRTIDTKVIDLFDRAYGSSQTGADAVGGGVIRITPTPPPTDTSEDATLQINLKPDPQAVASAKWMLSNPTNTARASGYTVDGLTKNQQFTIYFTDIPGGQFFTPSPFTVALTSGPNQFDAYYRGITTQPQSQTILAGKSVTFSVQTSAPPNLLPTYQWKFNGSGPISTSQNLMIPNVTAANAGAYTVDVTWPVPDAPGFVSKTSNVATLAVADNLTADPDSDGMNNQVEFAFNLNPKVNDRSTMTAGTGTAGLPLVRLETISNQKVLTIEFVRRRSVANPGITYHVEFGSDLTNWGEVLADTANANTTIGQIDGTWERVKVTDTLFNQTKRFGRIRLTVP